MNTFKTVRISIPTLKNFLRYMERENIKWSQFRLSPPAIKSRACELLADDYNKQCDNEEDKVSPGLVAFALSGNIKFRDNQIIRSCPVYETLL